MIKTQFEWHYSTIRNPPPLLSFFGHIKRHGRLEKTILEGKLEGKRKRGKLRRVWTDDIKNWLEMSVKEAGNLAYDRDQ